MKKLVQILVTTSLLLTLMVFSIPADAKASATKTGVVDASSLNVRSGPGVKYKKMGSLKNKSQVTVYSQTKTGWAQIRYNKKKAYVSNKYLRYYSKMPRANAKKISDRSLKMLWGLTDEYSLTHKKIHAKLSPGFTKQYIDNFMKRDMEKDKQGRYQFKGTDILYYFVFGFQWELGGWVEKLPTVTNYTKNGKEYLIIHQNLKDGDGYVLRQTLYMTKINGVWKVYDFHRSG